MGQWQQHGSITHTHGSGEEGIREGLGLSGGLGMIGQWRQHGSTPPYPWFKEIESNCSLCFAKHRLVRQYHINIGRRGESGWVMTDRAAQLHT